MAKKNISVGDEVIYRNHPNPTSKRGVITHIHYGQYITAITVELVHMTTGQPIGKTERVGVHCVDHVVQSHQRKSQNAAYDRAMKGV